MHTSNSLLRNEIFVGCLCCSFGICFTLLVSCFVFIFFYWGGERIRNQLASPFNLIYFSNLEKTSENNHYQRVGVNNDF